MTSLMKPSPIDVDYPDDEEEDYYAHRPLESSSPVRVEWSELQDLEHLTCGSMCSIYSCKWKGCSTPVVAKLVRSDCAEPDVAASDLELELQVLRRVRHPNVIKLVGAGKHPQRGRFLLLERLEGGTLSEQLEGLRKEIEAPKDAVEPVTPGGKARGIISILGIQRRISSPPSPPSPVYTNADREATANTEEILLPPPTKARTLNMARDALALARAMHYLHALAIDGYVLMHRDLKPDNIAFSVTMGHDGNPVRTLKVIDFGLAKLMRRTTDPPPLPRYKMTGETGSPRYMAPECHLSQPYNEKVDVYSFAMCMWEMLELDVPFKHARSLKTFRTRVVHGGERPPLVSDHWPNRLAVLVERCWRTDVDSRPNFSAICRELKCIIEMLVIEVGEEESAALERSSKRAQAAGGRRSTWTTLIPGIPLKTRSPGSPSSVPEESNGNDSGHVNGDDEVSSDEGRERSMSAPDTPPPHPSSVEYHRRGRSRSPPAALPSPDNIVMRKRQQRRKSSIVRLQNAFARFGGLFTPSPSGGGAYTPGQAWANSPLASSQGGFEIPPSPVAVGGRGADYGFTSPPFGPQGVEEGHPVVPSPGSGMRAFFSPRQSPGSRDSNLTTLPEGEEGGDEYANNKKKNGAGGMRAAAAAAAAVAISLGAGPEGSTPSTSGPGSPTGKRLLTIEIQDDK